jgi:hypothetical protein
MHGKARIFLKCRPTLTRLWGILYLGLLEEDKKETRLMLNEVYRILSISPCSLLTISKMMHVALKLVEAYLASEVEDFRLGAINELRLVKEFLEDMNNNCKDP